MKKIAALALSALALTLTVSTVRAQVGKGLADLNTAPEAALAALPNMNATVAKDVIAARPFGTIVEFNTFALGKGLTQPQLNELYAKAFIHVNLNTGTREEILLIPGAGNRMVREFKEYRPWTTQAQFDKEISKYVGAKETARLWRYVVIDK